MSATVFSLRTNEGESWLVANPDGTLTYHREGGGWALRSGLSASEITYTPENAKARWPNYAAQIDMAVAEAVQPASRRTPDR